MPQSPLTAVWCEIRQLSDALEAFGPDVKILVPDKDHPDPVATAVEAQAILASSGLLYDTEVFRRLPNLEILVRTGIGTDNVVTEDATAAGVLFCNTPAGPTESTAEHTIALMLACAKRVPEGAAQLAEGRFAPRGVPMGRELMGKTLGLMGFGRIGQRVAHICQRGFGMRVVAHDPVVTDETVAATGLEVELTSMEEVLAQADFLSLHAPSIPATHHMINRETIARMKDGAFLFNLARGPLVDGDALLDALDSGKLAGAGIDVFDPEPPPPDSRLRNHPRLVATPHSATTTVEARERIEAMAVEEILRYFDGREPNNPLNPEVLNHTAPQACP